MKKNLFFSLILVLLASISVKAQTPTVVFSDNFDRSSFTSGSTGGTPATTYTINVGGAFTVHTTLVSGSNYRVDMTSPAAAQKALIVAPMTSYGAPFSRELNLNVGVVTWTFNMRTSTAATSTAPAAGVVAGGIDLCGNAANNILNGSPVGYAVLFNNGAKGGVELVRFSGGLNANTALIVQSVTVSKTDYYSVRVTYDPATDNWSLFVRDDGASGFADPSSGVTVQQGSTITDNTYTGQVNTRFGAVYTTTSGAGKTMSLDNYQVTVTVPPCVAPSLPTGLTYSNTATSATAVFTPAGTPTGYILVESAGPLSGLPTAGQAVTVGTAVGANGTIVGVGASTDSSVTTSSALTANTTYTMTLFPYNNTGCLGGPLFSTTAPSTTITTCPNAPALTSAGIPTSNTIPAVSWSAPDAGGGVYTTYTYLLNVYTDAGLSVPAPGYPSEGTIVTSPTDITGLTSGVTYYYTITAADTACNSVASGSDSATTSIVPCSGTPTTGATSSTATIVTGSAPFTLGLTGASGETGISFQWQSSTCGATWANIGSTQSIAAYPTSESAATYYRCVVTCANSGNSATSAPLYVGNVSTAYCSPASTNGCSEGDGVNAFSLTGACGTSISDAGPMICTAVNTDHTNYTAVKLLAGNNYNASVNSSSDGDDVYVWIDFDNSGTFDASELVYSTTTGVVPSAPFFYNFSIPIPSIAAGATPGLHRMRVVVDNAQTLTTGCTTLSYGTSVDYMVKILPNLTISYNSPLCLPNALTLTALPSISCGSVYSWSGPSGYSNVTVNSNTITPPATAGVYSVSVTVNGISSCPTPASTLVSVFTAPIITGITGMCVGSTATLAGSPAGGNWTSSNTAVATIGTASGLATGVALGNTTISYTLPSTGCSSTQPMNITPVPAVYAMTGGGPYCTGTMGTHVGLSNSTVGVSYQLYNGGIAQGAPVTGTGLPLDFGLETTVGSYTVVGNPGTSCSTNMSGTANVSLLALPGLFNVTGGGNYCPGATGVDVVSGGSEAGITYQLYVNGTATGAPHSGDGSPLDFGLQTTVGTYNVIGINPSNGCASVMTDSVAVGMYPLPATYLVTGGGAYCIGGAAPHIGLNGSDAGGTTNYVLYTGGATFGSPASGTGEGLDFGPVSPAGTYSVVATNSTTGCTNAMTGSVAISINAAPTAYTVTGGGTACAGTGGLDVALNGSDLSASYNLYNGTTLISSASGTGSAIDFGLQALSGTYTVVGTLAATGCNGTMNGNAIVTINNLPTAYNITGGGSYCAGTAGADIMLDNSDATTTYQLLNGGSPVGTPISGIGAALDFGQQPAIGNYTIIATSGSMCINNMNGSVAVAISPLPGGYLVTGGGSFCPGSTGADVALNGSDAGISYQLQVDGVNTGLPLAGIGSALDFGLQTANGSYSVMATDNSSLCTSVMPGTAALTVYALPAQYPLTGGGSYCAGSTGIDIGLSNSDAGTTYQLYNGAGPVGPSAGGSGMPVDFGLQTVAGNYIAVATNTATGCTDTMAGNEAIAVNALPEIYTVTGGGSICPSSPGTHIGLSSSQNGVSYQLYKDGILFGAAVTGTGTALDLGLQSLSGTYTVEASNITAACTSNMAGSASISFYTPPAAHTVTGGGSYFCAGGTGVSVGLDGSDAGVSYQLLLAGTATGAPLTGTGAALDFGLQLLAGNYTIMATSTTTGCTAAMPGGAAVVVNGQPTIYAVSGGGSYCTGTPGIHIGVAASNVGIVYQLYVGTTAIGSPLAGNELPLDFGPQTTPGNYSVLATSVSTGCSVDMAGMAGVAISPLPVVHNVSGSGSYCAGAAGLHVLLNGSNPGINYKLYQGGAPTATSLAGTGAPLDFGIQAAGNYTIVATSTTTTCSNNMTGMAAITVNSLPGTFAVTGGGTYCAGGTGLHITQAGSETGASYQLYANGTATSITVGGTGSALDFGLQAAIGNYTVMATMAGTGCSSSMTGFATIATSPLPVSYTIGGGGNYCASSPGAHILLNGSTSGISYQLYNGTTPAGVPMFGTGSALDFGPETGTGTYSIGATNLTSGCVNTMSGTTAIAMLPAPAAYAVTGGGTYCAGVAGVHVSLDGSAIGTTYQLYANGISTGGAVAGTGGALDLGLQSGAGSYTVMATTTASGCSGAMTGSTTVAAGALPTVFAVSSSTTGFCSGGAGVTIALGNSETGVNYQLYRGTTAIGTPVAGTAGPLSYAPQFVAGSYTVVARNATTSCSSNMTGTIAVSVNPLPVMYNVTGGGGICLGGAGVHVALTGSATGISYQLYQAGIASGLPITGTGSALDLGVQTVPGVYTVMATNTATGCTSNMTGSASISINPAPVVYTVTGGGSFCLGGAGVHVTQSGSGTGVSYQLYKDGIIYGGPVTGSGTMVDFGLQTLPGAYTATATNLATGCVATMAGGATVNTFALPAPHTITGGGSYCAGGTGVHVGISGSNSGVAYRLYNGSVIVGLAVAGTGTSIDFGLQTGTGTYTVIGIDDATSCASNMTGSAIITTNALPDIYTVTGGGNYCAGGAGEHIGVGSSATGVSYTLYYGSTMSGTVAGTGAMLDLGVQTGAGSYTVHAANDATGCTSLMAGSAVIGITPSVTPTVSIATGTGDTLCSGTLTTFTAVGTNGGVSPVYQWTVNGVVVGAGMSYNYIPLNGDVVSIAYTSSSACAMPVTATTSSAITVFTKEMPGVTVSANPGTEVCQGTSVIFTATPSYGGATPVYEWMNGMSVVGSGPSFTFVPVAGDVITCKMTSNYRCRLANSATTAPVNMVVDVPATPVVTIAAYPGVRIGSGDALTLQATVTNGGPAPAYSWVVNGITVPGATSSSYVSSDFLDGDNTVACNVLSSGGCAGTPGSATVTIHVSSVGIQNIATGADNISVMPNPSKGTFVVKGTFGNGDNDVVIEVTDLIGQVVYKATAKTASGALNERVQLGNNIANGMYILNLRSGTDNKVFHVVVGQ